MSAPPAHPTAAQYDPAQYDPAQDPMPAVEACEDDAPHADPLTIRADGTMNGNGNGSGRASKGVLAIDMDDVLCNTNATIVEMHRELFPDRANPPIKLEEFEHYLYWHNRGWGTQTETVDMVGQLYRAGLMDKPRPVPGAREGLLKLKEMGYTLIVITARSESQREGTEKWLSTYFPDIFEELHFTGAFNHLIPATMPSHAEHAARREVVSHKKRTKHEVMRQTGAMLLVDDSAENALAAAAADPPAPVLLFGSYPWNLEIIPPHGECTAHPHDKLIYVEREEQGVLVECKARRGMRIDTGWLPDGVTRVANWDEVVAFVEGLESGKNKI